MFHRVSVAALSLALCVSPAFADGMPFTEKAPQPILTPLDKALEEIDGAPQEAPVRVIEPAPQEEVAAPIEQDLPPPATAPVPEYREVAVQPNSSFFGMSVGLYDAFTHDDLAAALNLEWQPGVRILGRLQPIFGAMVTSDGTLYGYGGVGVPFQITKNVFLMPSVAAGLYKDGGGHDLGQALAFRVGTELAYQFENKSRLGINAHIITNGESLDREDRTEVISLVYTVPIGGK